ncbi:MAG: ABC transporter permease [Chitinophagales bacterium]|nr:ABC transporter permease [Chitinophagales bacterium]
MQLLQFIAKRLFNGLLVMFGVIVVIFVLFNVLPVNSARMTLGQRADTASVEAIEREFRLNLPWYHRLLLYFNDISPLSLNNQKNEDAPSHLNPDEVSFTSLFAIGEISVVAKAPYLGKSFQTRRKVSEVLGEKIYPTFMLAISAMLLASVIGIILGIIAAIKQYSIWDNAILVMSTFGISQPAYFSGIILAMVFGYYLSDWTGLNVRGSLTDIDYTGEVITIWKNLWLPMIALGVRPVAIITQLTRSSMLDVLNQDYIRTARAKGLSYYSVVFKHALRNALNPVVTSISGWLAALLTGAFFIEKVFDYKGLGLQTIESLLSFDFPVVMGSVLFVAFVFVVMNIFTDILYSILDPRVTVK